MNDLKVWAYDDTFNPVTDLNENFATVKSAIEALEEGAGTDEQDISDLKTKVGSDTLVTTAQDLSGAVNELDDDLNHASTGVIARLTSAENSIGTLQTQAGNATLVTSAQTLSGAINELDDDLNHASTGVIARVGALETKVGSAALETASANLSGAVNEIVEHNSEAIYVDIYSDGIKTYSELLNDVRDGIQAKLNGSKIFRVAEVLIQDLGTYGSSTDFVVQSAVYGSGFMNFGLTSTQLTFRRAVIPDAQSNGVLTEVTITDSSTTFTNLSSQVPVSGKRLRTVLYQLK